ncbi:MAG: TIGR00282 family metallophosphoesterase [Ruminococcaceae bacterium]|nr:TIGR00282 family metallophosphoesterase [Oscillospiraceae bacterium]
MRLLAVGDVCGRLGCEYVRSKLPNLKKEKNIDVVIINGENSAEGNGVTNVSAEYLFSCGADIITGGNHSLRRKEVYEYLDQNEFILRPHNLPEAEYGRGYCLVDFGKFRLAVINLSGKIYLERVGAENPFICADELLKKAEEDGADIIVVDFHAEATSEKRALGLYLDGKVSAFFGTHTHIQTADEQILPQGTGYITDLGMTGPKNSVLGVKSEIIINRLRDNDMSKFEFAEGDGILCGCIFDIDLTTKRTTRIERISI